MADSAPISLCCCLLLMHSALPGVSHGNSRYRPSSHPQCAECPSQQRCCCYCGDPSCSVWGAAWCCWSRRGVRVLAAQPQPTPSLVRGGRLEGRGGACTRRARVQGDCPSTCCAAVNASHWQSPPLGCSCISTKVRWLQDRLVGCTHMVGTPGLPTPAKTV